MLAGLSIACRAALDPFLGHRFPLLFSFPAVLATAVYCGWGPALLSTFVAGIAGIALFNHRSWFPGPEFVGLVPFFVASFLVIGLVETVRRGRRRELQRLHELRLESERREREQEISAQLRAIVESSDDAIASIDLNGLISSWNLAAERIFGYSEAAALGQPVSMLFAPDDAAAISQTVDRIRHGGRVKAFETHLVHRDGASITASLTISPIHGPGGRLAGVSFIARDVTERKNFERRLLESQKRESLGVLAGGVAHDFNNLLTTIIGNASLVRERLSHDDSRERLGAVLRASERAALLVQQLLAYSGKGAIFVKRLDLSQEIRAMDSLLRATVPSEVELKFDLAGDLPPVQADASQMRQMVMNLVVNAGEAIDARGEIFVATRADSERGKVILDVRDTGCGIDEAIRARIFDPFFTTKFTGRGLGLAAVMGIIRASHGDIEVESAPGRGSTFRVFLPAAVEQ